MHPLARRGTKPTPRVLKTKKKGEAERRDDPADQVENFISWVRPKGSQPRVLEEEEEEEEVMTGLLDRYAARKRKRQESFERGPDIVPNQAEGSNQPSLDGGSKR